MDRKTICFRWVQIIPSRITVPILSLMVTALLFGCFNTINTVVFPTGPQPLEEETISGSGKDKIVLMNLNGVISNQKTEGLLRIKPSMVSRIKEELDKASDDPDVKAVVLRINSPGGTVTASDILYHEVIQFKENTGKIVIASIMDVGASGGYYTAVAADKIIAHPTTVTGSIGVIMVNLNMRGLLEKIGVSGIAIKSGDKKDMGSPFREMTDEERGIFQGVIDQMYDRFVSVVAQGRKGLKEDDVRKAADGRIYTAPQALELGLIDKIGYLDEAIELAKEESGLPEATIVTYIRPGGYAANIYSETPMPSSQGNTINLVNVDFRSIFPVGTPQFMYLWVP